MITSDKLSIHTSSPIHEWLPICNFHGYLIFTEGLIRAPGPNFAPNNLNKKTFMPEKIFSGFLKKKILTKYHTNCFGFEAPMRMVVLYDALFTCFMKIISDIGYEVRG